MQRKFSKEYTRHLDRIGPSWSDYWMNKIVRQPVYMYTHICCASGDPPVDHSSAYWWYLSPGWYIHLPVSHHSFSRPQSKAYYKTVWHSFSYLFNILTSDSHRKLNLFLVCTFLCLMPGKLFAESVLFSTNFNTLSANHPLAVFFVRDSAQHSGKRTALII
jgi:hypothetical protein